MLKRTKTGDAFQEFTVVALGAAVLTLYSTAPVIVYMLRQGLHQLLGQYPL